MAKKSNYRKFMATIATASIVIAGVAPMASATTKSFTDVPDRYQPAVNYVVSLGVNGKSDTSFGTYENITRADAAVFLANVLRLDTQSAPESNFTDVPDRAKGAVNALKAANITSGKTATKFGSDSLITRGELAVWLHKGFNLLGESEISFTDVSKAYEASVQSLVANGVTAGVAPTKFGLIQPAMRGDFAVFLYKAAQAIENGYFELSVMHTNDTHSNVDKIAKRVTAIKEFRSKNPDALLLDAGDVFSGTLYFNEFLGQADLKFMNYVGYDAMTFGNHEFDLGASEEGHQALANFIKNADFPFVSSNVNFSNDPLFNGLDLGSTIGEKIDGGKIYDGIIKTIDGQKIGIFGLTTEETKGISSPGKVEFSNYIDEAERMVKAFEKKGVNKIIALTHLGYDDNVNFDNDLELAKQVEGIDIIVGGHTHTKLQTPTLVSDGKEEPTVIVQAYQYSDFLGTLKANFDYYGKLTGFRGELIDVKSKTEDAKALELLKPYKDKVAELKNLEIGASSEVFLDSDRAIVRTKESELGNLIADGMLAKAKTINPDTVIALTNGGGIRASIDKGEITLGEVLELMPFGNTLGIMDLKGSELKEALEHAVSLAPNQNGAFLHVAGMKYTYDSSKPAGERVVKVEVKNADGTYALLDETKNYLVATNTFTAKGGDNYSVFAKVYEDGRLSEPGYVDYEMFIDYVKSLEKVEPVIEGRIVDVNQ